MCYQDTQAKPEYKARGLVGPHVGGDEVVMTTAATNHPEVTQREITLHPIRFKGGI